MGGILLAVQHLEQVGADVLKVWAASLCEHVPSSVFYKGKRFLVRAVVNSDDV